MSEHDFKIGKKQIIQQNQNISFNNSKLGKVLSSIFGNNQQVELDADAGLDVVQISETEDVESYPKKVANNRKYPLKPDNPPSMSIVNEWKRCAAPRITDIDKTQSVDCKTIKYDTEGKKLSESVKFDDQNLTETTFFDKEEKIICKVIVGENNKLESAEFYDKNGKLISSTNKDGETTSQNGSNVKIYFDPVVMRISGISDLDPETGNLFREIKTMAMDYYVAEYDLQTGEKIQGMHLDMIDNSWFMKTYKYNAEEEKGYMYSKLGNETIEYDSETGNVIKRTRENLIREYDPTTGVETKRTDIDNDGNKTVSEYDPITGKKVHKYSKVEDVDFGTITIEESFYDNNTGNITKKINTFEYNGTVDRTEEIYNPVTGHKIKRTEHHADESYNWFELDSFENNIRGESHNSDGSQEYRIDCETDPQTGKVTKVIKYDEENNVQSYITYEYNTETEITKRKCFNFDNRLKQEAEYNSVTRHCIKRTEYNEGGTISRVEEYDATTGYENRITEFYPDGTINKKIEFELNKHNRVLLYTPITTEYYPDGNISRKITHKPQEKPSSFILRPDGIVIEYNSDGSIKNEKYGGGYIKELRN